MPKPNKTSIDRHTASRLLNWYDINRRLLPWRAGPGEEPNVYHVWLSEIMLQQTKVATVLSYYLNFLHKWPTLTDLATATRQNVLQAWAGLGYYARARNLHACAQIVMEKYGGTFPKTEKELLKLPGIGHYTAAAIVAIAHGQPSVVVDGNVERVVSRIFQITQPIPLSRPTLRQLAAGLTPSKRPGDYAQAIMDLGSLVCTPRKPKCNVCPLHDICLANISGTPSDFPKRTPRKKKQRRYGVVYWIERRDGAISLRQRPENGIFGGMTEIPGSLWKASPLSRHSIHAQAPIPADWKPHPGRVYHSFTHFDLELKIMTINSEVTPEGTFWCRKEEVKAQALPSLMHKIMTHMYKAQNA